jgi:hypothetical protein
MSVESSRSSSPYNDGVYNDGVYDKVFNDLFTKHKITTPTREKLPPEQKISPLRDMRNSLGALKKMTHEINDFPDMDSGDSQGSMDSGKTDSSKTDSVNSEDDEFIVKLKRERAVQSEKAHKMRERIDERKKLYATMTDEEVTNAKDALARRNRITKKLNTFVKSGLSKKTRRGGRKTKKNKRKTKKTKRKTKKTKRKTKKTKRKTRK